MPVATALKTEFPIGTPISLSLSDELLDILPSYRHPTHEVIGFADEDGMGCKRDMLRIFPLHRTAETGGASLLPSEKAIKRTLGEDPGSADVPSTEAARGLKETPPTRKGAP